MHLKSPWIKALSICALLAAALFFLQWAVGLSLSKTWYFDIGLTAHLGFQAVSFICCAWVFAKSKITRILRYFFVGLTGSVFLLDIPFGLKSTFVTRIIWNELKVACGKESSIVNFVDFLPCLMWQGISWVELFLRYSLLPILAAQLMIIVLVKIAARGARPI